MGNLGIQKMFFGADYYNIILYAGSGGQPFGVYQEVWWSYDIANEVVRKCLVGFNNISGTVGNHFTGLASSGRMLFMANSTRWCNHYDGATRGTYAGNCIYNPAVRAIARLDTNLTTSTDDAPGISGMGIADAVYDMEVNGEDLLVCGSFTTVSGQAFRRIARNLGACSPTHPNLGAVATTSNGNRGWTSVGSPTQFNSGYLSGIGFSGSNIFTTLVAGPTFQLWEFSSTGTTWTIRGQFNGTAHAMEIDGSGHVICGGDFTTVEGVTVNRIARWNGATWTTYGGGANLGANNRVHNLVRASDGDVYAAGSFTTFAGVGSPTGSSLVKLGRGSTSVSAFPNESSGARTLPTDNSNIQMAVTGGDLWVLCLRPTITPAGSTYLQKWNGTSWSYHDAHAPFNGIASTHLILRGMDIAGGRLFATFGDRVFSSPYKPFRNSSGQVKIATVGTIRGSRDSYYSDSVGPSGLGDTFRDYEGSFASMYVDPLTGYLFATTRRDNLASGAAGLIVYRWDGTDWIGGKRSNGTTDFTTTGGEFGKPNLVRCGSRLYLACAGVEGGVGVRIFHSSESGLTWSAAATPNNSTYVVETDGTYVYVAGVFTSINGVPCGRIARWDPVGLTVSSLGGVTFSGGDSEILSLKHNPFDNRLYVAGDFTTLTTSSSGATTYNRIAVWNLNSSSWERWGGITGANSETSMIEMDPRNGDMFLASRNSSFSSVDGVGGRLFRWNRTSSTWTNITGVSNFKSIDWDPIKNRLYFSGGGVQNINGLVFMNAGYWEGDAGTTGQVAPIRGPLGDTHLGSGFHGSAPAQVLATRSTAVRKLYNLGDYSVT